MGDTSITNKEDSIYGESGTECDCMKKNTKILIFVIVLAPGAHSRFGSGKNSQFKPER